MKKPVQKTAPANKPVPTKKAATGPVVKPVAKKLAPVPAKPVTLKAPVKPVPAKPPAARPIAKPVAKTPAPAPAKPVTVKAPVKPVPAVVKKAVAAPAPATKNTPRRKALAPEQLRGDKRKFYDALINLRGQITNQYRDLSASSLASTKQAGEELADVGSDNFNRDLGLAMLTEDNHKLAQIEEAVERVLHDEYGTCADCGKLIAEARLLAIPFTTVCVDCKARREDNEKYNPGGHFEEEPLFGADGDESAEGGTAEEEEEGEEAPAAKAGKDAKTAKKKSSNEDDAAEEDEDEEA
jgi:RNA polymerase-binding transcription factor DksA